MPFSKDISQEVLIKSKRHCCLCYRFCGRNIELHHIIPKAQGGRDSLENCVPLCFDCHADVGHYNNNHPKGKKISSKELKYHRDKLYSLIENGTIPTNDSIEYLNSSLSIANIDMDELNCLWDRLDNSSSDIKLVFHELALFRWSREEVENENRTLDPIFDITLLNPTPLPITLNRIGIFLLDYWQKLKGITTPKKVFISDSYRINLTSLKKTQNNILSFLTQL